MGHTKEELEIMENYKNAIDEEVVDFVNHINSGTGNVSVTVGILTEKAAKEIQRVTGKMVYGNRIVLDENGLNHIKNRHGEKGKSDESMKDVNDIARIPYVLANYDNIEFHGEYATGYVDANGKLAPKVIISKRVDGIYYIVEAVSDAKKHKNYIVSAYIKARKNESDPSVPNNA